MKAPITSRFLRLAEYPRSQELRACASETAPTVFAGRTFGTPALTRPAHRLSSPAHRRSAAPGSLVKKPN